VYVVELNSILQLLHLLRAIEAHTNIIEEIREPLNSKALPDWNQATANLLDLRPSVCFVIQQILVELLGLWKLVKQKNPTRSGTFYHEEAKAFCSSVCTPHPNNHLLILDWLFK